MCVCESSVHEGIIEPENFRFIGNTTLNVYREALRASLLSPKPGTQPYAFVPCPSEAFLLGSPNPLCTCSI